MARYAAILVLTILSQLCLAAENTTALDALKTLPKQELKSLALIEAHDGTPVPERWHFLVYDPNSQSGVREYIVEGGELTIARGVSQFADRLTKDNVIGNDGVRIDSDRLAQLAKNFAAANSVKITRMSYQLLKLDSTQAPLWRVHCLDEAGKALGTLVVTAASGDIVSHQGFLKQPKTVPEEDDDQEQSPEKKRTTEKKRSSATDSTAASQPTAPPARKKATADAAPQRRTERRTSAASSSNSYRRGERRLPIAEYPPAPPPRPSNPLGNAFRKLFRIPRD